MRRVLASGYQGAKLSALMCVFIGAIQILQHIDSADRFNAGLALAVMLLAGCWEVTCQRRVRRQMVTRGNSLS